MENSDEIMDALRYYSYLRLQSLYENTKKEIIRDVEIKIVDELEPRALIHPTDESIKLLGKVEIF